MTDCCAGRPAPAKPWEQRAGSGAARTPAEGLPKPWERPAAGGGAAPTVTPASATTSALAAVTNTSGAVAPPRPWEHPTVAGMASTSYGAGYGATAGGYGGSMYSRCVLGAGAVLVSLSWRSSAACPLLRVLAHSAVVPY